MIASVRLRLAYLTFYLLLKVVSCSQALFGYSEGEHSLLQK